ncbi:uncharacterized protein [Aristolochia californica]|uniref:uncharacterized protein n=1 Tax=Aristolochia californica TaxID=171875 RepID=UPI0035DF3815
MEGGRRRTTLTEQMSIRERDPFELRELLKVREAEDHRTDSDTQTLGSVIGLGDKPPQTFPTRTLLDIIREEESNSGAYRYGPGGHKINWKSFKDRLRIRRTGSAWSDYGTSLSVSADLMLTIPSRRDPPPPTGSPAEAPVPPAATDVASTSGTDWNDEASSRASAVPEASEWPAPAEGEAPPVRVSLMTLLEQTDRHSVLLGGATDEGKDSATEDDEEEEEEASRIEGGEYVCCVCMVRHKGAAFIPCGHTFCRLCSRELWVSRGNCPLCNGYILEILDIF